MATQGIVPGMLIQFAFNGVAMGCSDKVTLNIDQASTSAVCKASAAWDDDVDGRKSWSMDVSGFIQYDSTNPITAIVTAMLAQSGGTGIPVAFGTLVAGDPLYTGKAAIRGLKMEAGVDGAATYSFQMKGKGALTEGVNPIVPQVTSFLPASGPVGTGIIIRGQAFLGATAVHIGTVAATSFQIIDNGTILAVIAGSTVDGTVRVTNATGQGASVASFDITP